ncbi:MAG: hypothetical protein PHN80_12820 [Hespellia sp.]|nr:hypothetical protein [Hespellia sp.]
MQAFIALPCTCNLNTNLLPALHKNDVNKLKANELSDIKQITKKAASAMETAFGSLSCDNYITLKNESQASEKKKIKR